MTTNQDYKKSESEKVSGTVFSTTINKIGSKHLRKVKPKSQFIWLFETGSTDYLFTELYRIYPMVRLSMERMSYLAFIYAELRFAV